MENNLIIRLRNATGQIHKDLEALPVSKIIMSPELTIAGYADYLQRMLTIHHAVENLVFPVAAACITDLAARKKEALIRADLNLLQAPAEAGDTFPDTAFRSSLPFCMGMLYVTEGSTLGGQYILKNIQKVLSEQAAGATAFFNAYGPRTGSMWKAFTEQLNTYGETLTDTELQEVEAGAVYGFARISEQLAVNSRQ